MVKKRSLVRLDVKGIVDVRSKSSFYLSKEKNRKKFYWVLRENGKIISRRDFKSVSKDALMTQLKKTHTLNDKTMYTPLTNVTEHTRYFKTYDSDKVGVKSILASRNKVAWYKYKPEMMYVVTMIFSKHYTVTRTSDKFERLKDVGEAKAQAWRRLLNEVGEKFGASYDSDEGAKSIMNRKFEVKEGIRYYTPRNR